MSQNPALHLYIAYKNYSSWSLRPWLAMKVAGIPFNETLLPFYHDDSLKVFAQAHDVPACVPALAIPSLGQKTTNEPHIIWDSMAIMEYLAEEYPEANLWPQETTLRALARSTAAELHSGFLNLRSEFPMNCRTQATVTPSDAAKKDLERLAALWERFAAHDGNKGQEFLCGHFTIVDAMYAPVMWRVSGYNLHVSDRFEQWSKAMKALPAMQEWLQAAQSEAWTIDQYDRVAESG